MPNNIHTSIKNSFIFCAIILYFMLGNAYAENKESIHCNNISTNVVLRNVSLPTDDIYYMKNLNNTLISQKYISVCDLYQVDHEKNTITLQMKDITKVANLECYLKLLQASQYIQTKEPSLLNKKLKDFMNIKYCETIAKDDEFLKNQLEKVKFLESIDLK